MDKLVDLKALNTTRKSFYGKARVAITYGKSGTDYKKLVLWSYNTPVAKIDSKGRLTLLEGWDYSQTTVRHIREFLQQYSFMDSHLKMEKLPNLSKKNIKKIAVSAA